MTEKSFTFLEIRLGDGNIQLGPKSLGGLGSSIAGGSAGDEDGSESADDSAASTSTGGRSCPCPRCEDGCDCRGCAVGKLLVVVGVAVALAVAAWKLFGSSDLDAAKELDDLEG